MLQCNGIAIAPGYINIYPLLKCWQFYQRNTDSQWKADAEKMRNQRQREKQWMPSNGKEEGVVHFSCMTLFIILPISRLNEPNTSENQKIDSNLTARWLEPI